jgi:uncharacterized protein (DUF58 family)
MVVVSRRYHLHWPGVVFVITTLLVALGAINSQHNLLYWLFGLAVGSLLFSGILSGAVLMGVEIERLPSVRGVAGQPLRIAYRVSNRSRMVPALALHIEEWSTNKDGAAPTWSHFVSAITTFVPWVPRRGSQIVEAQITPDHRGQMTFASLRVWTTFPFGITRKSVLFRLPDGAALQETLIRPQPIAASAAQLRQMASLTARTERAPRSGVGTGVPVTLREFVAGDSPRRIAWKRSAIRVAEGRTPLVRQESRPSAGRLWIVLRSVGDAQADEVAIRRAAGVLEMAAERSVPIGLSVPDADVMVHPNASPRHINQLYDGLATLQLPGKRHGVAAPQPHPRDMVMLLEGAGSEGLP